MLSRRATEVICSSEESIAERVMQITEGRGAYGATDAVGGDTLSQVITSLRKGGTGVRISKPPWLCDGDLHDWCISTLC